ncbi:MAG: YceI family protein [Pseudomonadota bacterium]
MSISSQQFESATMQLNNSTDRYGAVSKTFHWLTALLILAAIPLGIIANDIAAAIKNPDIATTSAEIARTAFLFSIHKTIGVASFVVALARIIWALSQPKPGLLNGDKRVESLAAETVHWLLYGSLVMVPLTGWIHHAATTGFAPIWWPFGQNLPFVPKDEMVAEIFSTLHFLLSWLLIISLLLHIGGALKHHLIEKDATLQRMLPGITAAKPSAKQPGHGGAFVSALVIWTLLLGGGGAMGMFAHHKDAQVFETALKPEAAPDAQSETGNAWTVTEGTLSIGVTHLGNLIEGSFADWAADIDFNETPDSEGVHGSVSVDVAIGSLTLGSITSQAMGKDYFNVAEHPAARFEAEIIKEGEGYVAQGDLTIKDVAVPITMPFELTINGETATASGGFDVDRRGFGIGPTDEGSVKAPVSIAFALTAEKTGQVAKPQAQVSDGPVWVVDDGALEIEVLQLGSPVKGSFGNWTSEIVFAEEPNENGSYGSILTEIDIASLTLGTVTSQAMGQDYFHSSAFPKAIFDAQIMKAEAGYEAVGTLTLKGASVPVTLPFDLLIEGNTAQASGTLNVDRRDFGIGPADEGSVAAAVSINFTLTATQK